jgi:hypothetical protein
MEMERGLGRAIGRDRPSTPCRKLFKLGVHVENRHDPRATIGKGHQRYCAAFHVDPYRAMAT